MADETVSREIVLKVLKGSGVAVSLKQGETDVFILAKDDHLEAILLPPEIGRRLLQYLKRRYGVPIHFFYNPLMVPGFTDDKTLQ